MKIEVCDMCLAQVDQPLPEKITVYPVKNNEILPDIGRAEIRIILRPGKSLCFKCLQQMIARRIGEVRDEKN